MKGVGTSATSAANPMKDFSNSMTQVNRRATAAAKSVAELKVHMGALGGVGSASSVVALGSGISSAGSAASNATAPIADLKNGLKELSFGALLAGSTLTAALTAPIALAASAGYEFNVLKAGLMLSTEAFYHSAEAATHLYTNLRALSDLTPFEMEDFIKGAGMIQPFTQDVAELENAMDIVAAAAMASGKITSLSIDRISLAFSQMLAAGKLTGNELRQLTEANVDVLGALSAKLGKSKGEIREMISEGEIGAKTAINAIGQFLGPRFTELLDKFSKSLPAAISSSRDALKELQAILQMPVEAEIADILISILPYIKVLTAEVSQLSPEVLKLFAAFAIGAAAIGPVMVALSGLTILIGLMGAPLTILAAAFALVMGAAVAMAAAVALNVGGLRDALGPSLSSLADNLLNFAVKMSEFGAGLVIALADGMMSALTVLMPVISAIGAMLSFWFAPGSPPKVAPNIDKYGAGTMEEWLKGFLAADFGILRGVAKNVEEILSTIMPTGTQDYLEKLLDIRMAVAHIISDTRTLGAASEDAWGELRDAAGDSYDKIKNIIDAYYELELATKAVKDQQKEITRLTKEWDDNMKPIQDQLDTINREQAKIDRSQAEARLAEQVAKGKADPKELELMRQKNLLEDQLDAMKANKDMAVDAAKAELDKRKEVEDAAKEHLEVLQGQVGAMNDMVKLVGDLEKAMEKAAGGGGGGGGKGPGGFAIDQAKIDAAAKKGEAMAEAMERFSDALKVAGPRLSLMAQNMETAMGKIADMIAVMNGQPTRMEKLFNSLSPEQQGQFDAQFPGMREQDKNFGFNSADIRGKAEAAKSAWENILAFLTFMDKSLQATGGGPASMGSRFAEWLKKSEPANQPNQREGDVANAAGAVALFVANLALSLTGLGVTVDSVKAGVAAWDKMLAETGANIGVWAESAKLGFQGAMDAAGQNISAFFNETVIPMWNNIMVTVGGFFEWLGTTVNQAGLDFWNGLIRAKDNTIAELARIWEAVTSKFNEIMALIKTKWDEAMVELDKFKKAIVDLEAYLKAQLNDALKGIYDKLIILVTPLQNFYEGMVNATGAVARFIAGLPGAGAIAALLGQGGGNPPTPEGNGVPKVAGGFGSAGLRIGAGGGSGGGTTINVYPAIYNTLDAAVWAKRIAREKAARQ
jgi:tape measure domain-containing protein